MNNNNVMLKELCLYFLVIIPQVIIFMSIYEGSRRKSRRIYTRSNNLHTPRDSAAYKLLSGRDDDAYICHLGLDTCAFDQLLKEFKKVYPVRRNRGRSRALSTKMVLALGLMWIHGTMRQETLCLIFGVPAATVSRSKRMALLTLDRVFKNTSNDCRWEIRWPNVNEMETFNQMILNNTSSDYKREVLNGVFGFVDGLNLKIDEPSDFFEQNAYYHGWLSGCFCSQVIVFTPDGCICFVSGNCPGSWHDARISIPLYHFAISSPFCPSPYKLLADSAFPCQAAFADKKEVRHYNQAAEWGMRSIQADFELKELALKGMIVYANDKRYFFKVHLLGSFGDIPFVSEINYLVGHMSYWACRFCTIFSDRQMNRMCFGNPANDSSQPCRLRTIDEYKNGDPERGIKQPSIFRELPSFTTIFYVGLDEFHLFSLNISCKLRDLLIGLCNTILILAKSNYESIADNILEKANNIPPIFDGEFKDVFRNTSKARDVDYVYIVPTLVIEKLQRQEEKSRGVTDKEKEDLKEAIIALESISKACSIATQYSISEELVELDKLIDIWLDFYRKFIPEEQFNINQHYLLHVTQTIIVMGPLRQISCRSMERRIQRMKKKISSTSRPEKNVENIFVDEASLNYNARHQGTIAENNNSVVSVDFKQVAQVITYDKYKLKSRLSHFWDVPAENINPEIKCAEKVTFPEKNRLFDSSIMHTQNNSTKTLALVHIFQNVQVSSGGIPHCNTKESYSNLEINQSSTLEVIEISDLMTTVASIVSKLKFPGRMYFFWPRMKRLDLEIGGYDMFSRNMDYYDY
ncbi:hypothetical protein BD770DRAFT_449470 [Pilaira anomala]|nr:hypothetical protein BD770DRAFT_449470 [Pilaira anomala]